MTVLARGFAAALPAGTAGWVDLVDEFDRWHATGRVARLWWRDDDAVAATPQLERLLSLTDGVPLALAVIPAGVQSDLPAALERSPQVAVLQHGWCHANHAVHGKKCEFPATRPPAAVAQELAAGRARLAALFGARFAPVLVPPWNRIAAEFLPQLPGAGLRGLSIMAPRRLPAAPAGIAALDVHVDLVAWRDGGGFVGTAAALAGLVQALEAERSNAAAVPVGILTHHLVMDAPAGDFLARLCDAVATHPAACWVAAGKLMRCR